MSKRYQLYLYFGATTIFGFVIVFLAGLLLERDPDFHYALIYWNQSTIAIPNWVALLAFWVSTVGLVFAAIAVGQLDAEDRLSKREEGGEEELVTREGDLARVDIFKGTPPPPGPPPPAPE